MLTKLVGFAAEGNCFDCHIQGFDAEWKIIDNNLYLTNIYSEYGAKGKPTADINKLFNVTNGMVKANWVTQKLWLPIGRGVGYLDIMNVLYEGEKLLTFVNGRLITTKRFDYPNNKKAANRKRRDSIPSYLFSSINWNKIQVMPNSEMEAVVGLTTSLSGKPVEIRFYGNILDDQSKEEIRHVLSLMPFPGIYIHGEFLPTSWTIPLKFTEADRKKYAR
ncbi:hypothetical protein [Mucilaginibacter antarcticus]|uniref:hypothetical protein n=1 Tax=Mucilaginibacter antarcticus TaxID=1855725 RepID=UPI00363A65E7